MYSQYIRTEFVFYLYKNIGIGSKNVILVRLQSTAVIVMYCYCISIYRSLHKYTCWIGLELADIQYQKGPRLGPKYLDLNYKQKQPKAL